MPDAPAIVPELELKYLLPRTHASFVLRWLEGAAAPDPVYPPARVISTYFDTPGLDLLEEKVNSDYLKTKVRVRWYAPLDGGPPTSPVFVELKSREGGTRGKRRLVSSEASAALAVLPIGADTWRALAASLREDVPALPLDLAPVMRLAYARYRFVDAWGTRASVDTDIHVDAVNPARLPAPSRRDSLPWAVFECKGHNPDLPGHLAPVTRFGARRSSFSKYLACYEHLTRRVF